MRVIPSELERFRVLAEQRCGLAFDDTKLTLLAEVLEHQAQSSGCRTAAEYLECRLEGNGGAREELQRVAERLTVGETYFFRNQDHFRVLGEIVTPARLAARRGTRRLRLLSAGCASGEEPYSLAMWLRESLPDLDAWDLGIVGVDLNSVALEKAASGRYTHWSLRETPHHLRDKYFQSQGKQSFRLDPAIQRMVRFERLNLNDPARGFWRPGEFDVIFCRNVLMYFSPRAARALVARMAESLAPGGFLFLGTAETLRGVSQAFHLRHSHGTFYYQLRGSELRDNAEPIIRSAVAPPRIGFSRPAAAVVDWSSPPTASWILTVEQARRRIDELARNAQSTRADSRVASTPTEAAPTTAPSEHYGHALDLLASEPVESATDVDALLLRAVLLTNQSKPEQAEALCREILGRDELNASAHYLTAICREHAGDQAAATDHDQYALYLDPSFAMPRLHLGLMARRAGKFDVARRELGEALVLLAREDASRIVLLGGGFSREGLVALCRAELRACGGEP